MKLNLRGGKEDEMRESGRRGEGRREQGREKKERESREEGVERLIPGHR